MGTFSVSGLSSGIDTASLVTQLMTVAAQPQAQLQAALTAAQSKDAAYGKIKDSLSSLVTAVAALGAASRSNLLATPVTPVWSATTISSSSNSVAASSGAGATPGTSITFDVTSLARAQVTTAVTNNGSAVSDPSNGLDITSADGTTVHVALADGSATAVASAVNQAGTGVRAQVVSTDSGPVLQLTSAKTGVAAGFGISGLDSTPRTVTAATDAVIQVGTPGSGGYTVSSATNTFTGVATGVTFTVGALDSGVTLSVASDDDSVTSSVQSAVDAVNTALSTLAGTTGKGAVLAGDATVRPLTQSLLASVANGNSGASFAAYGITLTSTGQLSFDKAAFAAAYAADQAGTSSAIGTVLAQRLSDIADRFIAPSDGQITAVTASSAVQEKSLQSQIDDWTTRLADQKTRLEAKYNAMETTLNRLQSQGSYLTSVFASLDSSSSSSSSS